MFLIPSNRCISYIVHWYIMLVKFESFTLSTSRHCPLTNSCATSDELGEMVIHMCSTFPLKNNPQFFIAKKRVSNYGDSLLFIYYIRFILLQVKSLTFFHLHLTALPHLTESQNVVHNDQF